MLLRYGVILDFEPFLYGPFTDPANRSSSSLPYPPKRPDTNF